MRLAAFLAFSFWELFQYGNPILVLFFILGIGFHNGWVFPGGKFGNRHKY
tara:strand:+ start:328 stop:477 length:150 start_codon:yes stop_codon:yes gene_type:complete